MPKLYPPGRILHIVRKYPRDLLSNKKNKIETLSSSNGDTCVTTEAPKIIKKNKKLFKVIKNKREDSQTTLSPVYQIIENDNKKFDELLISPRMLQDHMPDNLIKCMRAVLEEPGPKNLQENLFSTNLIRATRVMMNTIQTKLQF